MTDKDPTAGWTMGAAHTSIYRNGVQYKNMQEWTRPCAICGTEFSEFTRVGSEIKGNDLGTRNCGKHRGLKVAFDRGFLAWDGEHVVPGPECKGGVNTEEVEKLRMWKNTVQEEITCAYAYQKELQAEIAELKRRLAQYELPAALEQAKNNFPWSANNS